MWIVTAENHPQTEAPNEEAAATAAEELAKSGKRRVVYYEIEGDE